MKTLLTSTLALALATVATTAAAGSLTREQVRNDLAAAQRAGDIPWGETGFKLNEVFPGAYPSKPGVTGKTREQVRAEFEQARRNGDLIAGGDSGLRLNQLFPGSYPAPATVAGKTRAQVLAELAEARRLGDIPVGEDGRTAAERDPQRYAAVRAQHAAALERQNEERTARGGAADREVR